MSNRKLPGEIINYKDRGNYKTATEKSKESYCPSQIITEDAETTTHGAALINAAKKAQTNSNQKEQTVK